MKQQEAEILSSAGAVAEAVIRQNDQGAGWFVFLYGPGRTEIGRSGCDAVETARGNRAMRTWASLDSAQKWLAALPVRPGRVELEW